MRTMDWTVLLMEIESKFYTSIHSYVFFFLLNLEFCSHNSRVTFWCWDFFAPSGLADQLSGRWRVVAGQQLVVIAGESRDTDPVNNLNDPATSNYIFNDPQLHLNTNWDVFSPSRVCGWNSEPVPLEAALCLRCSSSSLLTLLVSSKQFLLQLSSCKHLTYLPFPSLFWAWFCVWMVCRYVVYHAIHNTIIHRHDYLIICIRILWNWDDSLKLRRLEFWTLFGNFAPIFIQFTFVF